MKRPALQRVFVVLEEGVKQAALLPRASRPNGQIRARIRPQGSRGAAARLIDPRLVFLDRDEAVELRRRARSFAVNHQPRLSIQEAALHLRAFPNGEPVAA